ncbi:MAG: hypothetical protein WCJ64_27130 [Rhodospirillaceae bacterium]
MSETTKPAQAIKALSDRLDGDLSTVEVGTETLSCVLAAFPAIMRSGEGIAPSIGWLVEKLVADVAVMRASYHRLNIAILSGRAGA